MTQEEKDLLLKDLCARLPYGVKFHYTKHPESNIDQNCDGTAIGYYCNLIVSANDKDFCVDRCKLYLRPLSSMTEEEVRNVNALIFKDSKHPQFFGFNSFMGGGGIFYKGNDNCCCINIGDSTIDYLIDWLNAHHFDYRGLIEKGLAIEVTEDNNPYKD